MEPSEIMSQPAVQYGFAGFAAALLAFVWWLVRHIIRLLNRTNQIIANNTEAIRSVDTRTGEELKLLRAIHDKLLARPCIAKGEEGA